MLHVCLILGYHYYYYYLVVLYSIAPCVNGEIRLVGGTSIYEGRVEVCVSGSWGTVCDDGWTETDATVVCRQLGYSTSGAIARITAFFGQGTDPILLDDVACTGTESQLINCAYTAIDNCGHAEDAGVTCQGNFVTPLSLPA